MKIKVLDPFKDGNSVWRGLDTPGMVRKLYQMVTPELVDSKHMVAGLCMFAPGEASSVHNHPGSEELNIILKGSGVVVSNGEEKEFKQNDFLFIPEGEVHQHVNTGNEDLWLVYAYSPLGQIPEK